MAKKFFYLNKKKANDGEACVIGIFSERVQDADKRFHEGWALYEGEELPHFISLNKDGSIRPATDLEKIERGQIILGENQTLIEGKIVTFDLQSEKVENGTICHKTRQDYIREKAITLESEKEKAREERKRLFAAADLLDIKIVRGKETLTDEQEKEISVWLEAWRNVPNNYTDISEPIENSYPETPPKIKYYL